MGRCSLSLVTRYPFVDNLFVTLAFRSSCWLAGNPRPQPGILYCNIYHHERRTYITIVEWVTCQADGGTTCEHNYYKVLCIPWARREARLRRLLSWRKENALLKSPVGKKLRGYCPLYVENVVGIRLRG